MPSIRPGAAAGANGLNVTLDLQLVADVKAIAAAVKGVLRPYLPLPDGRGDSVYGSMRWRTPVVLSDCSVRQFCHPLSHGE
jgi:hypothetical protein